MKSAAFFSFTAHMGFWGSMYYLSQPVHMANHMENFSTVPLVWMEATTDASHKSEEPFYEKMEIQPLSSSKAIMPLDFLTRSSKKEREEFYEKINHFSEHSNETKVTSIKASKNNKKSHEATSQKNDANSVHNKPAHHPSREISEQNLSYHNKNNESSFYPDSNNRMPRYPEEARDMDLEGGAMFRLTLRSDGRVQGVQCLSKTMNDFLKNEAKRTLLTWKFHGNAPKFLDVFVTFSLENS